MLNVCWGKVQPIGAMDAGVVFPVERALDLIFKHVSRCVL